MCFVGVVLGRRIVIRRLLLSLGKKWYNVFSIITLSFYAFFWLFLFFILLVLRGFSLVQFIFFFLFITSMMFLNLHDELDFFFFFIRNNLIHAKVSVLKILAFWEVGKLIFHHSFLASCQNSLFNFLGSFSSMAFLRKHIYIYI